MTRAMSGSRWALVLPVLPLAVACSGGGGSPGQAAPSDAAPAPPSPGAADASAADAPDAAAPPKSSGGSGGLPCVRRDALSGGRSICVARAGTVELEILEPSGGAGPVGLGLYLHGDGAGAYKSESAVKAMVAWADAHHALAAAALAPNGCAWWQSPSHDCSLESTDVDEKAENAAALDVALAAIERAWDVRDDARYYYGSSGGSIFLTDEWIPLEGGKRPGVFAIMCGGDASTRAYAWDAGDAARRGRDRLFFTYGDQDFLLQDIQASVKDFQRRGFGVTTKVIAGATHCAFDAHGEAVAIWTSAGEK